MKKNTTTYFILTVIALLSVCALVLINKEHDFHIKQRSPASFKKTMSNNTGYEIGIFSNIALQDNEEKINKVYIRAIDGPSRLYYGTEEEFQHRFVSGTIPRYLDQPTHETQGYLYRPGIKTYVESILENIQNWIIERYVKLNRIEEGGDIYKALQTKETLLDGRSSIVMITKDNDLNEIMALLRVSRRGDTSETRKLPLERRLDKNVPHAEVVRKRIPLASEDKVLPAQMHKNSSNKYFYDVSYGSELELKSFFHARTRTNYLPLLLNLAEESWITLSGDTVDEINSIGAKGEKLAKISRKANLNHPAFSHLKSAIPSSYWLECDQSMVKYYKSLGFSVDQALSHENDIVMSISREKFNKITLPSLVAVREKQKIAQYVPWKRSVSDVDLVWLPATIRKKNGKKEYFRRAPGFYTEGIEGKRSTKYPHNFFTFEDPPFRSYLRISLKEAKKNIDKMSKNEIRELLSFYQSIYHFNPAAFEKKGVINIRYLNQYSWVQSNRKLLRKILLHPKVSPVAQEDVSWLFEFFAKKVPKTQIIRNVYNFELANSVTPVGRNISSSWNAETLEELHSLIRRMSSEGLTFLEASPIMERLAKKLDLFDFAKHFVSDQSLRKELLMYVMPHLDLEAKVFLIKSIINDTRKVNLQMMKMIFLSLGYKDMYENGVALQIIKKGNKVTALFLAKPFYKSKFIQHYHKELELLIRRDFKELNDNLLQFVFANNKSKKQELLTLLISRGVYTDFTLESLIRSNSKCRDHIKAFLQP